MPGNADLREHAEAGTQADRQHAQHEGEAPTRVSRQAAWKLGVTENAKSGVLVAIARLGLTFP